MTIISIYRPSSFYLRYDNRDWKYRDKSKYRPTLIVDCILQFCEHFQFFKNIEKYFFFNFIVRRTDRKSSATYSSWRSEPGASACSSCNQSEFRQLVLDNTTTCLKPGDSSRYNRSNCRATVATFRRPTKCTAIPAVCAVPTTTFTATIAIWETTSTAN